MLMETVGLLPTKGISFFEHQRFERFSTSKRTACRLGVGCNEILCSLVTIGYSNFANWYLQSQSNFLNATRSLLQPVHISQPQLRNSIPVGFSHNWKCTVWHLYIICWLIYQSTLPSILNDRLGGASRRPYKGCSRHPSTPISRLAMSCQRHSLWQGAIAQTDSLTAVLPSPARKPWTVGKFAHGQYDPRRENCARRILWCVKPLHSAHISAFCTHQLHYPVCFNLVFSAELLPEVLQEPRTNYRFVELVRVFNFFQGQKQANLKRK